HCTIFLFIAASYTPFVLGPLREVGAWGWSLFGVVWFLAIFGIIFNAINMHNRVIAILSQILYMAIGWSAVVAIYPFMQTVPVAGLVLLLMGGLAYTIGALFYAFGSKKKYIHSIWHLFVLMGSIIHFFAILFFVILV
ncbi:MAG: hemolysin III family protein, partial [Firmicutes bacterium]|nr:hemolysin III family protein [Bacillota bacterium]